MSDRLIRSPWWREHGRTAESIVRLDDRCLGLRVRLESGKRVMMPLGLMTFAMQLPPSTSEPGDADRY
jgi:hypothetical protein